MTLLPFLNNIRWLVDLSREWFVRIVEISMETKGGGEERRPLTSSGAEFIPSFIRLKLISTGIQESGSLLILSSNRIIVFCKGLRHPSRRLIFDSPLKIPRDWIKHAKQGAFPSPLSKMKKRKRPFKSISTNYKLYAYRSKVSTRFTFFVEVFAMFSRGLLR